MKVKKLVANKKNDFLYMAIDDSKDETPIYLHRLSEEGKNQWYESKATFSKSTALKYYYQGFYKVVFYSKGIKGISKSNLTDWV